MAEGFSIVAAKGDIDKEVAKLKKAATKGIRTEMRKVVSAESKPARVAIQQSAKDNLPSTGGLNKFAAVLPSAVTTFTSSSIEMKIRMRKNGHDVRAINRGQLRHPVYGHRKVWVTQQIEPGFFDRAVEEISPVVRARVDAALTEYFNRL